VLLRVRGGHDQQLQRTGRTRLRVAHHANANKTADASPPIISAMPPAIQSIRRTLPGLRFAIKWKKAYYGLPERGWIIELVAYDVSVNVVFLGGADFDTPPPLGTTGRTRYVKVKTLEEAQTPQMQKWIEQAARAGVAGMSVRS
jgi:hypothetical protein